MSRQLGLRSSHGSWGLQTLFKLALAGGYSWGCPEKFNYPGVPHGPVRLLTSSKPKIPKNTYTQWSHVWHALLERVAADAGTGSHVLASIIFQQYESWWLPCNFNFFFIFLASFSAKCFPSLYPGVWALPMILSNLSVSPAISLLSAQMAAFEECNNFISPSVCSR